MGFLKSYSESQSARIGSRLSLAILAGWFSVIDVNNLWIIIKEKRRLRKEEKEKS